jgi:hypothetical protein
MAVDHGRADTLHELYVDDGEFYGIAELAYRFECLGRRTALTLPVLPPPQKN